MENPGLIASSDLEPPTSCFHPANKTHRFIGLVLMCFLCFGSYFCYDTPGALADNFKSDSHLSTSQFALLYSIYSWPNVVLCFIGGYLVDRCFGVRLGTIIYMAIVFIGAVIFAFGVYINAYWLMILGRFIFGIGGESLQVAVNNYVVVWFKGKELNMVFGLQLSISRFGSTVNFWVMEPIYQSVSKYYGGYENLGMALFIASLTCLGSLICALILGWMDLRAERVLRRQQVQVTEDPFQFKDILNFKTVFWLQAIICVAYYLAIFPFIALGKLFFERKFDFLPQEANTVNSMVYFLSAALSPFFGILIDKTGRNVTWIILSIITTIGSHFLLAFTFVNPYVGVMSLGISYSLLASGLWPLVAMVVPANQMGTAYGICQAVQNLGLAVTIIFAGMIVDNYGYFLLELFFLGCLFVSLIAAVLIYIIDSANDGVLNLSPSAREFRVKADARTEETANLLEHPDSSDQEVDGPSNSNPDEIARSGVHNMGLETSSGLERSSGLDKKTGGGSTRPPTQTQSDRIRSRYISQLLPSTNIPDRP